jgi:hypothetical protein
MLLTKHQAYKGDQTEEDEFGRACSTYGDEKCTDNFSRKPLKEEIMCETHAYMVR